MLLVDGILYRGALIMYDWTTDEDGYLIVITPPDKTTTNALKTSEAGTVAAYLVIASCSNSIKLNSGPLANRTINTNLYS